VGVEMIVVSSQELGVRGNTVPSPYLLAPNYLDGGLK